MSSELAPSQSHSLPEPYPDPLALGSLDLPGAVVIVVVVGGVVGASDHTLWAGQQPATRCTFCPQIQLRLKMRLVSNSNLLNAPQARVKMRMLQLFPINRWLCKTALPVSEYRHNLAHVYNNRKTFELDLNKNILRDSILTVTLEYSHPSCHHILCAITFFVSSLFCVLG